MKYHPIPSALYRLLRVTTRSRLSRRVCAKSEPYRNGQVGKYEEEKQVKPGFTTYQPQPKYSWALSKMKGKIQKFQDISKF